MPQGGAFLTHVQDAEEGEALSGSDILVGNMARNHFLSRRNDNFGKFTLYMSPE